MADAIDHLRPIVQEFIVVDTGSNDMTKILAREHGARVFDFKWEKDFAKARNFSLDKATGKWIFIIDPDERVAESDLEKIKALTESATPAAYSFDARNYCRNPAVSGFFPCRGEYPKEEQDYEGYFNSRKARLFMNVPTTRFVGSVHELVESTLRVPVIASSIPIHHYGSTPEITELKNKRSLYHEHGVKKTSENPQDWKAFFELGLEYISSMEYRKACEQLEKAKKLRPRDPMILTNLGYAYMESKRYTEAEMVLRECLEVDPKNHDAYLNLGVTQMRKGDFQRAIEIFDQLVKMYPRSFTAYRNAGNSYAHLKKMKAAIRCFEHALRLFPQYVDAKVDLGVVCFAAGRPDLAAPILEDALKQQPGNLRAKALLSDLRKLLEAKKKKG